MIYELDPSSWLIIGKLKGTTFEAIVFHRLHNGSPFPIAYSDFNNTYPKVRVITDADIKFISEHIKCIPERDLEYSKRLLKEIMMEHYIYV